MKGRRYLADTSIWGWAHSRRRPDITAKFASRLERDEIVTCPPVVLEALHRARTGEQYEHLFESLFAPLPMLPLGETQGERALTVQLELAKAGHGNHRRPAVDYLIAAIAEAAGPDVALWFFDKDLRVICDHTGQPYEEERSTDA